MKFPGIAPRLLFYIGLGVLSYLIFLVVFLPAGWLAWGATKLSQGTVHIGTPQGTVWSGRGILQIHGALGAQSLGDLQWRVNPLGLLLGRLQVRLRGLGSGDGEAELQVARQYMQVESLRVTLPVQIAGLVYAPAGFFAPTGQLQLDVPRLEVNAKGLHGNATVLWRGAGGRFTGDTSLGDYRIEVDGRGETAGIKLATVNGRLELAGTGQWRVASDGDLRFTGHAVAKSDVAQLEPLLNALGRDQGGGRRAITFAGRVPLVQLLGFRDGG